MCSQIDRKAWEVDRLGLFTSNAEVTEQRDDMEVKLRQAMREIERLRGQAGTRDADIQRTSQRMEALANEEIEEQRSRIATLEEELSDSKHSLAEAREEIQGLQFLVDAQKDSPDKLPRDAQDDLAEEIEDLKYDLQESERARNWLSKRLASTIESMRKLQAKHTMLKVLQELHINAMDSWSRRTVADKVLRRWTSLAMARSFARWQSVGERRRRLVHVASSIVQRWSNLHASVAFETWEASTTHQKSIERKLKKGLARWWFRSLSGAFGAWVGYHRHAKVLAVTARRIIGRWRCGRQAESFWLWLEHANMDLRHREALTVKLGVKSVCCRISLACKDPKASTWTDAGAFQGGVFDDIVQAVAHMYTSNQEAASQVLVRRGDVSSLTAEVEYFTSQEEGRPSAQDLADEVSAQVQNAFSRLRLRGKWTSGAEEHVHVRRTFSTLPRHVYHLLSNALRAWNLAAESSVRTSAEQDSHKAVDEIKQRLKQQAERTISRMLHIQLAGAFDSYHDRVVETRRKRETCRRVILRMQHMSLAGAFDMFSGTVEQLRAHRTMLQKVVSRWRKPSLQVGFDMWLGYLEVLKSESMETAREELSKLLSEELAKEKSVGDERVEREVQKRMQMCKRAIMRMFLIATAQAFDSFQERVQDTKQKRSMCQRVVKRMLHKQLAAAFDLFVETIGQRQAHRHLVSKMLGKWRAPAMSNALWAWMAYMEEAAHEKKLEALQQAREIFERDGGLAEIKRQQELANREAERRIATCKKTVHRMFHIQLAIAFDSFVESVLRMRERRTSAKRVIFRMLHTQLAAAFDCFCEAVDQLVSHRQKVQHIISRWKKPALQVCFERWLDFMDAAVEEARQHGMETAQRKLADQAEVGVMCIESTCMRACCMYICVSLASGRHVEMRRRVLAVLCMRTSMPHCASSHASWCIIITPTS